MRVGPLSRLWAAIASAADRRIGWQHFPALLGALLLGGLRVVLRQDNLYDTGVEPTTREPRPDPEDRRHLEARTVDGAYNDLSMPAMGSAGARFGRNVPLDLTYTGGDQEILSPNPRQVSRRLLARDRFRPATSLNLLAAAWVQFMVHDWFSHGTNQRRDPFEVELEPDDPWPHRPMRIHRTRHDPTRPPDASGPPTFANVVTAWWDGSQIYGSDEQTLARVRGDRGELRVENGLLPLDPKTHQDATGVTGNWWLGLSLLHTLFSLEHNAISGRLRSEYPGLSDDQVFDRARLANAALIAKIHTLEWTPAILANPALRIGMSSNWWGLLGRAARLRFGRIGRGDVLSGIPGSPTDHFGVPYSLTEEFVAVYRMHPLIPDDYSLRSHAGDGELRRLTFPELAFGRARDVVEELGLGDLLYSFGTANPGAITLHNFPQAMLELRKPDGTLVDLAATDILRVRERGVPRYNEFRKLMHKRPVASFEELTGDPGTAEELRRVYGEVDRVDLMVGLYAEPVPPGFGFSDTAFRIFILMASRRLNSDRFFTTDFRPDVYTPAGMQWVQETTFADVVRRHFPELGPSLEGVANPFAPWPVATGP
ncbi:MAG: peroxidase [Candidatus Dormibacteraeota bacterium]|nr:peroxidase [Candidatus Dormibacteraeota bacterium]